MAGHDTEIRKLHALSQQNSEKIHKLHEELRKLKERLELQRLQGTEPRRGQPRIPRKS